MSTLLDRRPLGLMKPAPAGPGGGPWALDWSHPLAQGLKICVPMLEHTVFPFDYAHHWRNMAPQAGHGGTFGWTESSRYGGGYTVTAVSPGASSIWFAGGSTDMPTAACSIVIAKRKTDTTNRTHYTVAPRVAATGLPLTGTNTCNVFCPYSDGTVYWDFGGTTGGSTRITAGGLAFGDDLWVFTAGPGGSKIIQNGCLRASHTTAISRTHSVSNPAINCIISGSDNDLAVHSLFYVYDRELTVNEAIWLTVEPYAMFEPPRSYAKVFFMPWSAIPPPPRARRALMRN